MAIAETEFDAAKKAFRDLQDVPVWGGRNTPAVFHEFCNAVAWTRAVDDRYRDRLRPALGHDPELWKEVQKIRSTTAGRPLEEARRLAKVGLHKFTPPYPGAGAKVEDGTLTYPVPEIRNPDDYCGNRVVPGRHAESIVEEFWAAVQRFVDQLLDVFYPRSREETRMTAHPGKVLGKVGTVTPPGVS